MFPAPNESREPRKSFEPVQQKFDRKRWHRWLLSGPESDFGSFTGRGLTAGSKRGGEKFTKPMPIPPRPAGKKWALVFWSLLGVGHAGLLAGLILFQF
jgi:hypothetical protein